MKNFISGNDEVCCDQFGILFFLSVLRCGMRRGVYWRGGYGDRWGDTTNINTSCSGKIIKSNLVGGGWVGMCRGERTSTLRV